MTQVNPTSLFYTIMEYPLPNEQVMKFLYWWKRDDNSLIQDAFHYSPNQCDLYSRHGSPSEIFNEYIDHINKTCYLWKHIPYVTHVYLANSITFNALHDRSDIDLLIIVKPGRLWIARLMSWFILWIFWLSRIGKRSVKKYCLSFYLEESPKSNLYSLLLQPLDLYMIFWLAHLVPLYAISAKEADFIWKSNIRLKSYLPNHPLKQIIHLGNILQVGKSRWKEIIEIVLHNRIGNMINRTIGSIRKPIILYKKKRLGKKWRWVILSDSILKFHLDKRKEIILKYLNNIKKKASPSTSL